MLISIVGATVVAVLIELAAEVGAKTADQPHGLGAQRARSSTRSWRCPTSA